MSVCEYEGGKRGEGHILEIINPGLQNNSLGADISQETMMHQSTQPNGNPMRTTELLLANKQMNTPIIVINPVQQPAQRILLHPIDLEIPKWLPVPASNNREFMPARQIRK